METVLFEHFWFNVVEREEYVYIHTRNSVVYVLPYRCPKKGAYLLGHFEVCPAHGSQQALYAITGQCEVGNDPVQVALQEIYEEAGIVATPAQLIALGSGYLSKQTDTLAHFFAIDVTHMPRRKALTDGSKFEQGSYCTWVSRNQALAACCVGLQALLARAHL